jgi:hypothetical protein
MLTIFRLPLALLDLRARSRDLATAQGGSKGGAKGRIPVETGLQRSEGRRVRGVRLAQARSPLTLTVPS